MERGINPLIKYSKIRQLLPLNNCDFFFSIVVDAGDNMFHISVNIPNMVRNYHNFLSIL